MTATLTRPSLADIEAAFKSLGPREQFWMLDKLASIAGLELDLDDLARQSAEASFMGPRSIGQEVSRLLWLHHAEPYHEMRDKYLAYAFRGDQP